MIKNKVIFNILNSKHYENSSVENYFLYYDEVQKSFNKFDYHFLKLIFLFYELKFRKKFYFHKLLKKYEKMFFDEIFNSKYDDFYNFYLNKYNKDSLKKSSCKKNLNLKDYQRYVKQKIYFILKRCDSRKKPEYKLNLFNFYSIFPLELRLEKVNCKNKKFNRIIRYLQGESLGKYFQSYTHLINQSKITNTSSEMHPIWKSILVFFIANHECFIGFPDKPTNIKKTYFNQLKLVNGLFALFNFYYLFINDGDIFIRKYFFYSLFNDLFKGKLFIEIQEHAFLDEPQNLTKIFNIFFKNLSDYSTSFISKLKKLITYEKQEKKHNQVFQFLKSKYPDCSFLLLNFLSSLIIDDRIKQGAQFLVKDFILLTGCSYEASRKNLLKATEKYKLFQKSKKNDNKTLIFSFTEKAEFELVTNLRHSN